MTSLVRLGVTALPALIAVAGDTVARRFLEFFATNIRNPVAGSCPPGHRTPGNREAP